MIDIVDFNTLLCVIEVKTFLGIASFLRKLVPSFAQLSVPLFDLLKIDVSFVYSKECGESILWNKRQLVEPEILMCPSLISIYSPMLRF